MTRGNPKVRPMGISLGVIWLIFLLSCAKVEAIAVFTCSCKTSLGDIEITDKFVRAWDLDIEILEQSLEGRCQDSIASLLPGAELNKVSCERGPLVVPCKKTQDIGGGASGGECGDYDDGDIISPSGGSSGAGGAGPDKGPPAPGIDPGLDS